MPVFGVDGYHYTFTVENNAVTFKFVDPEDATNTADVTVDRKDFPEGVTDPAERAVADQAYAMAASALNSKRDARLKKEATDATNAKIDAEAQARESKADFLANAQPLQGTSPAPADETPASKNDDKGKK